MPEEWLRRYYETGNNEYVLLIIGEFGDWMDRFLNLTISDKKIRVEIWMQTMKRLRDSKKHP